jgi:hypothetical protein
MYLSNPNTLLLLYAVSFLIGLLILYAIIREATRANAVVRLAEVQVKLLRSIALKLGVDREQIDKDIMPAHEIEKAILTNHKP